MMNRTPAIAAVCWGAILLVMMPAATQVTSSPGVTAAWTTLMYAEAVLIIMCAWAQLKSSSDAWTRSLVVIATLLALYVGVDLNETRDAQLAYNSTSEYSADYVSNGTVNARSTSHHAHTKIAP